MNTISGGITNTQGTLTGLGQAGHTDSYQPRVGSEEKYPEIGAPPKTPLRDRIAYPFLAIKNRMVNFAVIGAIVGLALSISVPAFVGAVAGGVIGGVVKLANMVEGRDSSAGWIGVGVGGLVGALAAAPVAILVAAVAAEAFATISLVGSTIYLPVDIYHAATQDNPGQNADCPEDINKPALSEGEVAELHEFMQEYISDSDKHSSVRDMKDLAAGA